MFPPLTSSPANGFSLFAVSVIRPDFGKPAIQVVPEPGADLARDEILVAAGAGKKHGGGSGLGTLDAFRVIMGDLRAATCLCKHVRQRVERKSHRADAHRRAIAEAVVGPRIVAEQPDDERAAVTGVRVAASTDVAGAGGLRDRTASRIELISIAFVSRFFGR